MNTERPRLRGQTAIYAPSLRAIRESQGMGRNALAAAAGMSTSYLKALELGTRTTASESAIRALADVLHIDPEAITRPVKLVAVEDYDGWPA